MPALVVGTPVKFFFLFFLRKTKLHIVIPMSCRKMTSGRLVRHFISGNTLEPR